uniref:Uncharacterized protein n=1 Tax=Chelonoidis abingdonii TaxID=106734 RepID=A0A8C0HAA4_CHEAB
GQSARTHSGRRTNCGIDPSVQEEKRGSRQPPESGCGRDRTRVFANAPPFRKGAGSGLVGEKVRARGAPAGGWAGLGGRPAGVQGCLSPQCSDLGFHLSLGRLLRTYLAAEGRAQSSWQEGLGALEGAVLALDPPGDKARLMEANPAAYCPPPRFEYHPHEGDEVAEVQAVGSLRPELLLQWQDIESRLKDLSLETEEVNKTLQATLSSFRELLGAEEPEELEAFGGLGSSESLRGAGAEGRGGAKRRAQHLETETFYLTVWPPPCPSL